MKKRSGLPLIVRELSMGMLPLAGALAVFMFFTDPFTSSALFALIALSGTILFLYHLIRCHALSPVQYLMIMGCLIVLTIVTFAFIYTMPPSQSNTLLDNGRPIRLMFIDGLYFSVTTLTTLGYGDIAPLGSFRIFAMTEVVLGVFYLGSFIAGISCLYSKK